MTRELFPVATAGGRLAVVANRAVADLDDCTIDDDEGERGKRLRRP